MKKYLLLTASAVLLPLQTWAASYQLNEYSVTGLGRAFAGVGVVGDDYSAIAFNPAGMSLMRSGIQGGITAVNLRSDINALSTNDSARMDHYVVIPSVFAQYKLNDKWDVGFGFYAPYGLSTQYKSGWFGETSALKSELEIMDFALALSYKPVSSFTIGASFITRYIYGHMTNNLSPLIGGGSSDFELDGWTVTGVLGMMYEPVKDTRFGLSWRLKSSQQVKGDHTISNNAFGFNQVADGSASPDLPETVTFSAFTKQGDFGISGTARWTHWSSSFKSFDMRSDSNLFAYPPLGLNGQKEWAYDYQNSWSLSAGLDYYLNKCWTLRMGAGWDQSPNHGDSRRTWRIPDNDRIWASAGFSYIQQNWQLDVGYSHIFVKSSYIYEGPADADGKMTNMQTDLLGIQLQYKF